jgi:hypothetical protein
VGIDAQAVDANANGLYDRLIFTTTLDIPLPGAYDMEYVLVSQQAPETVIWATSWSWWYPQGPITKAVAFTGPVIADAGLDGPYILKLVSATYYPPDAEEEISFVLGRSAESLHHGSVCSQPIRGFRRPDTHADLDAHPDGHPDPPARRQRRRLLPRRPSCQR